MAIIVSDSFGERGKKDAKRHREKQKEVIKDQLPEIISEEAIITRGKGKKLIKILIKGIEVPTFRPDRNDEESYGIGQGEGNGDVGNEPGVDFIETEVDIEELIEMMYEDLGLPKLTPKNAKKILVELGFKIGGKSKSGPRSLLNTKATVKEGIRRFWFYLNYLKAETNKDELLCFNALRQSEGILKDALELLSKSDFKPQLDKVEPFPIFDNEDLRFYKLKKKEKPESQAVIIAMMDVSGSMYTEKKYLARSMLYWLTEFLWKIYKHVEIRFIIHHSEARLVDEQIFFQTREGGGTCCYSAYELAGNLIDNQYSTDQWNVYLFHFSDGDDWEPERSVQEIKKCFDRKINMFGFGQICPDQTVESFFGKQKGISEGLLGKFAKALPVVQKDIQGMHVLVGKDDVPFLGALITEKKHILLALQEFLKKGRWEND